MSRPRILTVLALSLGMLVVSCARPSSDECYLKASARDETGAYSFTLSMDDDQYDYDVDLFLSLSIGKRKPVSFSEAVHALWISPAGARFEEDIELGYPDELQEDFFTKNLLYHYRESLEPVEYGDWTLQLSFPDDFENEYNANGVGIRLIRNGSR